MTNQRAVTLTATLIAILVVSVSFIAPASDAISQDKESQYLDAVIDYQAIPESTAMNIYGDAVFDSYVDGIYVEDIFIESFIRYVNQYNNGTYSPHDYSDLFAYLTDTESFTIVPASNSEGGGVTKIDKYNWGYDIYISSQDMNNIATAGSGAIGLIVSILKMSTPIGVITTLATTILGLILNNLDYDGIAFEIHTHNVVEVFGHEVALPLTTPMIKNVRSQ